MGAYTITTTTTTTTTATTTTTTTTPPQVKKPERTIKDVALLKALGLKSAPWYESYLIANA